MQRNEPSRQTLKEENARLKKRIQELQQNEVRIRKVEETLRIISSRFVGVIDINKAINNSLADMGKLTRAERAHLFLLDEDEKSMSNTHEWHVKELNPLKNNLQKLPLDGFPWWMGKLRNGELVHAEDTSEMPSNAKTEKQTLEELNIRSLLAFPVYIRKKLSGFIGFSDISETKEWEKADIQLLQTTSEIIGNALEYEQMKEQLKASEAHYRNIYNNIPVMLHSIDSEGKIIEVSNHWLETTRYQRNEVNC